MDYAIETKKLTKNYGKNRGIADIDLRVQKGDIFGYLGPNGAGKSTSIRCLLGMIYPTSGEAYIFGQNINKNHVDLLKKIGYMPSETNFYPSMKAGEIIRYAARLRKVDCTEEAKRLCDILEVDVNKKVSELSLGNRKKISIVCALQHNPELLIFDEPTSGLDPLMQEAFFNLVLEKSQKGTTCFLSSHVLPEVKKYCNRVGIIKDGKLIKIDTVNNLLKSNFRKVKIIGINKMPDIIGVNNLKITNNQIQFDYSGEMQKLINAFYEQNIKDIHIEEPSLEDVFMHYYE